MTDKIKHPAHYTKYSVEVIDITRHLPFCLGNVVKYVLRAPYKGGVEDCDKASQYLKWCDDLPVPMLLYSGIKFRRNVKKLYRLLRIENTAIAEIQADFLLEVLRYVKSGGSKDAIHYLIGALAKELKEY